MLILFFCAGLYIMIWVVYHSYTSAGCRRRSCVDWLTSWPWPPAAGSQPSASIPPARPPASACLPACCLYYVFAIGSCSSYLWEGDTSTQGYCHNSTLQPISLLQTYNAGAAGNYLASTYLPACLLQRLPAPLPQHVLPLYPVWHRSADNS